MNNKEKVGVIFICMGNIWLSTEGVGPSIGVTSQTL
jgi:hypothetical protein